MKSRIQLGEHIFEEADKFNNLRVMIAINGGRDEEIKKK